MRATIVTPWRDHRELERDYWRAIRLVDADVLIVDDGSEPRLPNGIRIDRSGFCAACNSGLDAATTDAVVFLNNDIAAASPADWLTPLLDMLEPGVLVGAHLVTSPHAYVDGIPMPYLDGWCLAGMRHDFLDLGGWDESLMEPAYYSDNELCLRARAHGMVLREARETGRLLIHKRNQTAGPGSDLAVRRATEHNRSVYQDRARELIGAAA